MALARRVGSMIMDEVQFRQFKEQNGEDYKSLKQKYEKQTGHYRHKRNAMRHHMDAKGIQIEDWPVTDIVMVGAKCIDIMIETTGLVEQVTRAVDVKRHESVIIATEAAMQWINEEHNRCAALSPVLLPTIVPPRPWTGPREGGYWTNRVRGMNVVKTFSKGYLQELADHEMPDVYDALNAMQHTAWAINTKVLEVVKTLWDNRSGLSVIPSADDLPIPVRPAFLDDGRDKEQWTEAELEAFREWKRSATDTHTMNAKLKSTRLQFVKTLMVAEMFAEEEEIFFPHQLDFRGRCYAIPMYLNPQGADLARGLIEFANGVAITSEVSRSWLAIHGCNCFGNDKVSLEDRVKWVEDNEQEILAIAADPYNNRSWVDSDKPWQYLAFCFEWAAFKAEGWGFVSTLPIQMDGSCNGLQNFSAALRDPVGGAAVNLIPADLPQDIYQRVADVVLEQVKKDACNHEDDATMRIAQGWLKYGITRKVCKRPVMTLAYGAKEYGFKQQVFEDTVTPAKYDKTKEFPWEGSGWGAANYLGKVIWDCVGTVVVAARQAMDWFQQAARAAAKEELPVRWTTPDGLVVLQAYPKNITKRIELTFGGMRRDLAGFPEVFVHLDMIVVLFFAWLVVIVSFFVLAVQLFITLIEFKLTTLAGFVLVPFALWNKTAFLAEKVLGNVVSAGIKVLVLAVIVGISSGLFAEFRIPPGSEPSIDRALVIMLASLSMLALGIFGPGIATGLVSGAPQLGAGAMAGAALGAAGAAVAVGAAATGVGGAVAAGARMAPAAARLAGSGARVAAGAASSARSAFQASSASAGGGLKGAAAGVGNVAKTGAQAAGQKVAYGARSMKERVAAAFRPDEAASAPGAGAEAQGASNATASSPSTEQPAWAKRLHRRQQLAHAATTAAHTLRGGDGGGSGQGPSLRSPDE